MTNRPTPIELACGHTIYLKITPLDAEEFLYCLKCGDYKALASEAYSAKGVWSIHADLDFRSMRTARNRYDGECLIKGCSFAHRRVIGWYNLRDKMHQHFMREHTERKVEISYAPHYPKGSPPPF